MDLSSIANPQPNGRPGHPLTKILESGQINWVIIGGESGPGARPCNVEWIRDLVGQCKEADVPAFVKQLGANATGSRAELHAIRGTTTDVVFSFDLIAVWDLADKKGGDPSEWPEDLRVREFPEVQS